MADEEGGEELFDPRLFFIEKPKKPGRRKKGDEDYVETTTTTTRTRPQMVEEEDVDTETESVETETPQVFVSANDVVARMKVAAEEYEREHKRAKQQLPPPPSDYSQTPPLPVIPRRAPKPLVIKLAPAAAYQQPILLPVLKPAPDRGAPARWTLIVDPVLPPSDIGKKPLHTIWSRVTSESQLASALGELTLQSWVDPYKGSFRVSQFKYPAAAYQQLPYAETVHVVDTFYRKALMDAYTILFADRDKLIAALTQRGEPLPEFNEQVLALSCRIGDIFRISLDEFHWLKWKKSHFNMPPEAIINQPYRSDWNTVTYDWLMKRQEYDINLIWATEVRLRTFRLDVLPFSRQPAYLATYELQIRHAHAVLVTDLKSLMASGATSGKYNAVANAVAATYQQWSLQALWYIQKQPGPKLQLTPPQGEPRLLQPQFNRLSAIPPLPANLDRVSLVALYIAMRLMYPAAAQMPDQLLENLKPRASEISDVIEERSRLSMAGALGPKWQQPSVPLPVVKKRRTTIRDEDEEYQ